MRSFSTCILFLSSFTLAFSQVLGSQLRLEIQSDCLDASELDQVFNTYLLPGLQELASSNIFSSSISREQESSLSFEAFSISSGDGHRALLEDEETEHLGNNTNATMPPSFSLRRPDPTSPPLDCPVIRDCPCSGCPGHWCVMFCGYDARGRRSLHDILRSLLVPSRTLLLDTETLVCRGIESLLSDPDGIIQDTCLRDAVVSHCSLE